MANEPVETPVAPVTPAIEPVVAVPTTPDPAPVAAVVEAPALVVETPAPVTEAAPVEKPAEAVADPLKPHTDTPTLLEEATKPVELPKEGEKPKEGEAPKPAEAAKTIEPAAPVVEFQPYTLPEGVKLEEGRIGEFNALLAKPDLTPQQRGQELVNMHIGEMTKYRDSLLQEQHQTFADTRAGWRKDVMADEQLGGSGHQTAMTAVAKMRDMFVSNSKPGTEQYGKDMAAFDAFLRVTGAGDHPVFLRLLHNAARRFDEPAPVSAPYKPPPDIGKPPGGRGSRARVLYSE